MTAQKQPLVRQEASRFGPYVGPLLRDVGRAGGYAMVVLLALWGLLFLYRAAFPPPDTSAMALQSKVYYLEQEVSRLKSLVPASKRTMQR